MKIKKWKNAKKTLQKKNLKNIFVKNQKIINKSKKKRKEKKKKKRPPQLLLPSSEVQSPRLQSAGDGPPLRLEGNAFEARDFLKKIKEREKWKRGPEEVPPETAQFFLRNVARNRAAIEAKKKRAPKKKKKKKEKEKKKEKKGKNISKP